MLKYAIVGVYPIVCAISFCSFCGFLGYMSGFRVFIPNSQQAERFDLTLFYPAGCVFYPEQGFTLRGDLRIRCIFTLRGDRCFDLNRDLPCGGSPLKHFKKAL